MTIGRGHLRILVANWKDIRHPAAGGAEVFTHETARRWASRGHHVTIFASRPAGLPAAEVVDGVHTIRRGSRVSVYREARRWYEREGQGRFDVIIDEVNTRPFRAPEWAGATPVLALIHQLAQEVWSHEVPWPLAILGRRLLEPRWLRLYRTVRTVTVSRSSHESLQRCGLTNVVVTREAVADLPVIFPPRSPDPTVIFVGRMAANKRPADAIRAALLARQTIPRLRIWIVGSGPLETKLRRKFAQRDVTFFGRVDDRHKYELLVSADALLATSVREGWGLVVSEAAHCGTRTLAYDVPGLRDSVSAAGGRLVAPSIHALAEAIVSTLPVWRTEARGRIEAGVASWDDVARDLLTEVNRVAAPAPIGWTRHPAIDLIQGEKISPGPRVTEGATLTPSESVALAKEAARQDEHR